MDEPVMAYDDRYYLASQDHQNV